VQTAEQLCTHYAEHITLGSAYGCCDVMQ